MNTNTIKIQEEEMELTNDMIQFYKNQTRKKRVTKKGIEKFFNSLLDKFYTNLLF
jgi:hypothetical protein